MWRLLLLSFSLCLSFNHVQARIKKVEERECRSENDINVHQGKALTLTSDIEPLSGCYFVSTHSESGDECCFNKIGEDEDCTSSGYYKHRDNTKCPEYSLTYDSIETRTCNLTIKSVSAAGKYKSYDADHKPLQSCLVTVSDKKADGELKGEFIFVIGFTLLFLVFLVVFLWRKSSKIKEILRRKDCQRITTVLQCVRLLTKDNDDEDKEFHSCDEEAANPTPNPIGQEAESMKLVKAGPEADGNREGVISFSSK